MCIFPLSPFLPNKNRGLGFYIFFGGGGYPSERIMLLPTCWMTVMPRLTLLRLLLKTSRKVMVTSSSIPGLHASSPSSKPLDASDVHNLYDKVHIRTDCSEETGDGCALNEDCKFVAEDEVVGYICQCRRGYILHPRLRWCVGE